jgi:hypothetical protein
MPMKKQLNVDIIQSELRGGSAFFPGYKGSSAGTTPSKVDGGTPLENLPDLRDSSEPSGTSRDNQGVPPPVPRTVPRTVPPDQQMIPKVKRPIKQRQPFDIFEDQYIKLRQIADAERGFINGRGMSQMVRDAIDAYLSKNPSSKE